MEITTDGQCYHIGQHNSRGCHNCLAGFNWLITVLPEASDSEEWVVDSATPSICNGVLFPCPPL